ncbi:MAG: glycosyltransferase family 4 protein [Bacteroidales bacterium]|jgi:glycosyltransferase involved in cell wall biosynthesis|nr:glycosyltransferase family 4 protein [Bacteroidales bacterium]
MEQMKKIKVVFICHFSNSEIRNQLALSKLCFINKVREIFGKGVAFNHKDFAPWITNYIKEFEQFNDVELHIVAPHYGMKRLTTKFKLKNTFYYFFRPEFLPILSRVFRKLNMDSKNFRLNRLLIKRFLKDINADIVNLIGTENPYYSIASLDIKDTPVFVSVQTVYTNPKRKELTGNVDIIRWNTELKVHKKEKYYGATGRMHHDLILNNNPAAIIFKFKFPVQKPELVYNLQKKYDFVFFAAGVTPKKGVEDAIEALALVKAKYNGVTLNIVGSCDPEYKQFLDKTIKKLNLQLNVFFNSYFPLQSDMHNHIQKSRFALLPVKLDVISGTIVEAMQLELPLITYKTTGTPYLNKDGETVLISDIGDIKALASNMLKFMDNTAFANELAKKAKAFAEKEFDNTSNARLLVECYRAVMDHYHNNTPIPDKLLFNIEEFPTY